MNFDEALQAHSQWKLRLTLYVDGNSHEQLEPAVIRCDDRCVLGQWIHGDGKVYAEHPEYAHLVREHASFHHAAANVVSMVQSNRVEEARRELETSGTFFQASLKTITAIRKLREKVET